MRWGFRGKVSIIAGKIFAGRRQAAEKRGNALREPRYKNFRELESGV
jgi:hypothetical protein